MKNPHILLTTDFSDESLRAFEPTAGLARELGGTITLLHVVPELTVIPHGAPLAPLQVSPDLAEDVEKAKKSIAELRARLGEDIDVKLVVETSENVEQAIADWANHNGVDLIAIASHGRSGIKRLVLGSVAEAVLRKAGKPVIVFPM